MVMLSFGIDNSKVTERERGSPSSPPRSRLAGTAIIGCPDRFVRAAAAHIPPAAAHREVLT